MKNHIRLHCTQSLPHNGQSPMMWQAEVRFRERHSKCVVTEVTSWVSNPGLALLVARQQFFAETLLTAADGYVPVYPETLRVLADQPGSIRSS